MIWRFVWRFVLSGVAMGAMFGAVYGTIAGESLRDITNPTMLGVVFGGFFGAVMGAIAGFALGQVTLLRYGDGMYPADYRRNMAAVAFIVAFITGGVLVKLVLFGTSLRGTDWGVVLLLALAGGIGAALTGYWAANGQPPRENSEAKRD